MCMYMRASLHLSVRMCNVIRHHVRVAPAPGYSAASAHQIARVVYAHVLTAGWWWGWWWWGWWWWGCWWGWSTGGWEDVPTLSITSEPQNKLVAHISQNERQNFHLKNEPGNSGAFLCDSQNDGSCAKRDHSCGGWGERRCLSRTKALGGKLFPQRPLYNRSDLQLSHTYMLFSLATRCKLFVLCCPHFA